MKTNVKPGDILICNNAKPLNGNTVAPPLVEGNEYPVKRVVKDRDGNDHFDVGLVSNYAYVRSIETGEDLPDSDSIHWCHPSRFKL